MADRSSQYGVEVSHMRVYTLAEVETMFKFDHAKLAGEVKAGRLVTTERAGVVLVAGGDVLAWLSNN